MLPVPKPVHERLGEHVDVVEREVEPLRAGRGHDVRGVAREEQAAVAHRLADIAAHPGDAFLEDRPLGERPALEAEPCLQLLPDTVVRPLGEVLVGAALDVEATELGRAKAQEREPAVVVRVDELVVRGRDRREDPEPAERVLARELGEHACRDARAADAVEPVAARDHVAFELLVAALVPVPDQRALGLEVVHRDILGLEVQGRSGLQAETDEVLDELGLAVDDDRTARRQGRSAGSGAAHPRTAARCRGGRGPRAAGALRRRFRPGGRRSPCSMTPARMRASTYVAAPVLEDHRVDALQVKKVAERESGWTGPDDPDLRARRAHSLASSSRTRWAIANAPFAAGTPQ